MMSRPAADLQLVGLQQLLPFTDQSHNIVHEPADVKQCVLHRHVQGDTMQLIHSISLSCTYVYAA